MSADNREQILQELEQTRSNWQEKKSFYERKLVITDSAGKEFELKEQIKECEQEIKRLTKKIESFRKEGKPIKNQPDNQYSEFASSQSVNNLQNLIEQVEKIRECVKQCLKDNEKVLLPLLENPAKYRYDVGNNLLGLLERQKHRDKLAGWARYLEIQRDLKTNFVIKDEIKLLLDAVEKLRTLFYSRQKERYEENKDKRGDFETCKHYLELVISNRSYNDSEYYQLSDDELVSIARNYLDNLRNQIDKIGSSIAIINSNQESQSLDSIGKSQTISTSDTKDNFKLMEFRDRQSIVASVVFFFIPQLAEQEPNISNCALVSLNKILKERLLDRRLELRILSSIKGAIAVIPDSSTIYIHQHYSSTIYIHQHLSVILDDCKNQGIPVRLGVTHGELEVLKDADTLFSFIGIPMNVAARLSTSDDNKGILYDSTYIDHVQPLPTSKNNDPLHPRHCNEVDILGKPHDPIFKCREPKDTNLALSQFNNDTLSELDITPNSINGIAIAYDLPKFSQGDRSELSKRFRSVIDSINTVKNRSIFPKDTNQFFFSPGGDGGILILPIKLDVSLEEYLRLAFDLIEKLEVESDSKDSNIDVKSRVGVHSGIILLYQNAEGIPRPTGLTCFIADEIASDDLAKQQGGIIITEKIKGSLFSGSTKLFEQEYESLTSLDKGAAKDIQRYAKKLYPLS